LAEVLPQDGLDRGLSSCGPGDSRPIR